MSQFIYPVIIFMAVFASIGIAMETQLLKGTVQFAKNNEGAFEFADGETCIITKTTEENQIQVFKEPVTTQAQYQIILIQGEDGQEYTFLPGKFPRRLLLEEITKANVLFLSDLEGKKVTFMPLYKTTSINDKLYPLVETIFYEETKNRCLSDIQEKLFFNLETILQDFSLPMLKDIHKSLSQCLIEDEEKIKKLNYIKEKINQKTKDFKQTIKKHDNIIKESKEDEISLLINAKDLTFTDKQLEKLSPDYNIKRSNYVRMNPAQRKAFAIFMKFRELCRTKKIKNSKKTFELEKLGFNFWTDYIELHTIEQKLSKEVLLKLLEKLTECEKQILNSRDAFFFASKTRYSGLISGLKKYIYENHK